MRSALERMIEGLLSVLMPSGGPLLDLNEPVGDGAKLIEDVGKI